MREGGPKDLIAEQKKIEIDLATAKDRLEKNKKILEAMVIDLRNTFVLGASVQDQMKKASSIVGQTDFLFYDPNGATPQLIFKNPISSIDINESRGNVNVIISEWNKKIDISLAKDIDIIASEKIKKDAETIKAFIEDLSDIVGGLAPTNSGLSQFQINSYSSQVPPITSINEVIFAIGVAIENSKSSGSSQNNDNQTSVSTGNQTTSNLTTESSAPTTVNISYTPEEVSQAQVAVTQAQNQVTNLQIQLAQIEEQIVQTPIPASVEPVATTPDAESPSVNTTSSNTNYTYTPRKIDSSQGIIIQPGPPQLIQGTDPF